MQSVEQPTDKELELPSISSEDVFHAFSSWVSSSIDQTSTEALLSKLRVCPPAALPVALPGSRLMMK